VSKSEVRPDYYAYIADDEIDLRELAMILVRQWKVIVAVVAAVVSAVAMMNAFFIPPTYESSAVVQFRTDNAGVGSRLSRVSSAFGKPQCDDGSEQTLGCGLVRGSRLAGGFVLRKRTTLQF